MIQLTNFMKSILIGILLSDGWVQITHTSKYPRIGLKQSMLNFVFLWNVFTNLSMICYTYPKLSISIIRGKNF